jgi:hypothetical protein
MNKHIENLAYKTGIFCDGTLDNWDQQAVHNFALNIITDVLKHINTMPTQQLVVTTHDLQFVTATKQQITKYIRTQYGLTSN